MKGIFEWLNALCSVLLVYAQDGRTYLTGSVWPFDTAANVETMRHRSKTYLLPLSSFTYQIPMYIPNRILGDKYGKVRSFELCS